MAVTTLGWLVGSSTTDRDVTVTAAVDGTGLRLQCWPAPRCLLAPATGPATDGGRCRPPNVIGVDADPPLETIDLVFVDDRVRVDRLGPTGQRLDYGVGAVADLLAGAIATRTAGATRLRAEVQRFADAHLLPCPPACGLREALTALAYPLLGAAAVHSAQSVPTVVPPALGPILSAATARRGAATAFGTRATRPVIAALGRTLADPPLAATWSWSGGEVNLANLALAVMAPDALAPDHVAAILRAPGPRALVPDDLGSSDVTAARAWLAGLHPYQVVRLVREIRGLYNGVDQLRMLVRRWARLTPSSVPRGLDFEGYRSEANRREQLARWGDEALPEPLQPLRSLAGTGTAGLRFCVPRRTATIIRWGAALHHCLGSLAPAAQRGKVYIVGVARGHHLLYTLSVAADGTIIEFRGAHNTDPAPADRRVVLAHLREHRIVPAQSTGALQPCAVRA